MPKPVGIHKGVLKELGPSIGEASNDMSSSTYSYVQFDDGTMLRNLVAIGGLDGKLEAALKSKELVELHVQPAMQKKSLLLAVNVGGQLYANEPTGTLFFWWVGVAVMAILGLATIWVFGLGLLFWAFAFYLWLSISLVRATKRYVRGLRGAVLL
ncbi:hypothetical protein GCM10007320_54450 [Pseudorhodoferax aquiterrae]|uniref:Uncharacterized protein n=1 Tax=Pseudorhodoferax aquiterrae TaxID=747304 RepID=A0ABQ3G9B3_9BURK|nr:hypothetical protein [Pseudorhodoferax aquiterrae]GHC98524.1 hypothetical protein GCM10007320_54450 [Pseudorhodoferax aquiterrae]